MWLLVSNKAKDTYCTYDLVYARTHKCVKSAILSNSGAIANVSFPLSISIVALI